MVIQAIASGLAMGSIYALIAVGYYITFETTTMLNFSQGEFLMLGALVGLSLHVSLGLAWFIALLGSVAFMTLMGIALERMAIRPIKHMRAIGWVMSTVGVGVIIKNVAVLAWGGGERPFPSVFGTEVVRFLGAGMVPQEIFNLIAAVGVIGFMLVFLKRSLLGKALRAVALNADAASLMGIEVRRMIVFAFALSSALAGFAGVLVAPITFASPNMGTLLGLKAFAAAIIGGLNNPVGILLGGLLLGVAEFLISTVNATWREATSFLLIMLVLAIRPQGLFSSLQEEKF